MAQCTKCGVEIQEGLNFCPACGDAVNAGNANTAQNGFAGNVASQFTNVNDTTSEYDPQDIAANKGMSVLSYIWILFLVPMFAAPQSKFAKFHVGQGVTLFALSIATGIISFLLGLIQVPVMVWGYPTGYFSTPWYISIVQFLITVPSIVFMIMGIVNAASGKAKELPIIGKFNLLAMFGMSK